MLLRNELIDFLKEMVSDERLNLFYKILNQRSQYFAVALEDLYQTHNISAVLRTSECFGFQDVHIIEKKNSFQINNEIALGSASWLKLHRYNKQPDNTLFAINSMKQNGYRIVATTPHEKNITLEEFDIHKGKAVFFFGTERKGLSKTVLENADEFVKIPMYGFTESFNISVSVGITLQHLRQSLEKSEIDWRICSEEKQEILLDWLRYSIRFSDKIIKEFYKRKEIKS